MNQIYEFKYFLKRGDEEKSISIEAENEVEAVKKLYDKVGVCEWGCILSSGKAFTDEKYPLEKELFARGC